MKKFAMTNIVDPLEIVCISEKIASPKFVVVKWEDIVETSIKYMHLADRNKFLKNLIEKAVDVGVI